MNITYTNHRFFYGTLEDVFTKLILASELEYLYRFFFYEIKKQVPSKYKPKKRVMVDAFIGLKKHSEDIRLLMDSLPEDVHQAYEFLIWQDILSADEAQKTLGFDLIDKDSSRGSWELGRYGVKQAFTFIALMQSHQSYYSHSIRTPKDLALSIPPAIREWLKPFFPKPKGYNIEPLSETDLTMEGCMTFDASPTIAADLGQLADFLKRSNPARTKRGDYAKTSIRKADSLTASGEWYSKQSEAPELDLMRHTILLDFIEGFESALINRLTAPEIKAAVFRDLLTSLEKDHDMLSKWLIKHLKTRNSYYEKSPNPAALSNLFSIFKRLPPNAWVSIDNLKSMQFYQAIDILFFFPQQYEFRALEYDGHYQFDCKYYLDPTNQQAAGIDPLIDGMAFLLSAFGLIELAYKAPQNKTFKTSRHPYLTVFDGAQAVRLTDVGTYAFGISPTLELKQNSRKVATLRLHTEQLHITCKDPDPVTELALREFMEQITPEFYRMTRTSMLKGCQSPKEVTHRVTSFRSRIGVELPENWQSFLDSLESEKSALIPEKQFQIFTLTDRPDLQQHFTQDPVLKKLVIRAEGHRIAISKENIVKVRAHLRKLGYLVET